MQDRLSDIKVIAVHVHGPGVVHKKGGPITAPADFDGLKLRGPSRQANKLLETLGATPVGMPVPAFPESLSKGIVDGKFLGLGIDEDNHPELTQGRVDEWATQLKEEMSL